MVPYLVAAGTIANMAAQTVNKGVDTYNRHNNVQSWNDTQSAIKQRNKLLDPTGAIDANMNGYDLTRFNNYLEGN